MFIGKLSKLEIHLLIYTHFLKEHNRESNKLFILFKFIVIIPYSLIQYMIYLRNTTHTLDIF